MMSVARVPTGAAPREKITDPATRTASPEPAPICALEAALGVGRASVLKGLLHVPFTTTELARQLSLSPAAVSAHLSRLKAAELVELHRSGKRVYYRLSGAGESLLDIFGETGATQPAQRT